MKLYKVTQNQYKTLQQSGSIVVGGVTYTYNEHDIYVITDPWAPEYRLSWDFAEKGLQITKDGEVVSQIGIDYAVMANHANTAAAIVADGTQVQASELKATVNEFALHKKDTSNPHSVTKAQVGLGNVVNAGQTATPTSGSNSYFTAGGAYTLQQSLNNSIEDTTLQANQQWGGPDIAGSLSPVEAVATPTVGANKLAFCNPDGVTIEYSTDGGST